jgi:hypothetical protein
LADQNGVGIDVFEEGRTRFQPTAQYISLGYGFGHTFLRDSAVLGAPVFDGLGWLDQSVDEDLTGEIING